MCLAGSALSLAPAPAANPQGGTLSEEETWVRWQGATFQNSVDRCEGPADANCDHFFLTVDVPEEYDYRRLHIDIYQNDYEGRANNLDVQVFDPQGNPTGEAYSYGWFPGVLTSGTSVYLRDPVDGTYEIRVRPDRVVLPGSYSGEAYLSFWTNDEPPPAPSDLDWQPNAIQAVAEAPLRVVMVGFGETEIDETKVTEQLPAQQRPGVLIGNNQQPDDCEPSISLVWDEVTSCTGAEGLINHGRQYFSEEPWSLLPIEFQWKPEVVYAPEAFADGLFAEMMDNSFTGEHSRPEQEDFLRRYNAARGWTRGVDRAVVPGTPTRFIDAESMEAWISENAEAHLGFPVGTQPGVPGFTIFFLNTFDSPSADRYFPKDEFHHLRIERLDPDTGEFSGIDWGRVWGGKTRSVVIDLGAAPNAYEAETWGHRGRSVFGSSAYDPPLWEYRAGVPRPVSTKDIAGSPVSAVTPSAKWDMAQLSHDVGRNVVEAASFLFFRSYLYPPKPQLADYHLSSNVWHDRHAAVPFASDLRKLYDQEEVMQGLRSLVPYLTFNGDTVFKNLAASEHDDEQIALESFKRAGYMAFLGVRQALDYVDSHRDEFYRGDSCATTIPVLNLVVEKHYAWALPLLVLGIAPSKDGKPWGALGSVNDVVKWKGADTDPTMALIHPQIYSKALTYTTVHEVSHYLGLSHPHDTIGAAWDPTSGRTRYWSGFSWTFNSTAAPTTYSHVEMSYNILDQESIARGHASYYLEWADAALYLGGYHFKRRGIMTIADLPPDAAEARQEAIDLMDRSRKAFSVFSFIEASTTSRQAWAAAARYLDSATQVPSGTSEISKGTKAEGCP